MAFLPKLTMKKTFKLVEMCENNSNTDVTLLNLNRI